ncbi:Do family serine endopeptidase [Ideonella sp. DXS22W]|uniref:Probable periplasmic serine endoprotease DegP-like n=1 Tax=Pseudaquabacterium inlustre TaxID=2984192 RepID=A0ABU9CE04_9BURK
MKLRPVAIAALAAGLVAGGTAGAIGLPQWLKPAAHTDTSAPATEATQPTQAAPVPLIAAQGFVPDWRAVVKRASPAVVGVTVAGLHKASAEEGGGLPPEVERDPFFQFFRGMPGLQQRRGQGGGQVPFKGQGSGFIVSADGLVLTNAHVVRDAREVTVRLADRREFVAKVVGADPVTDVAVLKIDAKGLPTVPLGDSRQLEVGDAVLAIGAPYGLEQTATQGIVSAKGRSLPGDAVVPFIQTDAAVNPGNSGGPLFDGHGAVVGINAQIYSQSGGFQGLSFAIPIDVALKVKDQIVATGSARHARLGVAVQDLTLPLAESFGLTKPDGALVSQVVPGSAAAEAGLKPGDVITEVDGQPVERSGMLSSRVGLSQPGQKVTLKVWRDHRWQELKVTLGTADADKQASASDAPAAGGGQLGLALRPLQPEERRQAQGAQGLVIEGVSGPAARAGIEAGDLLVAVNGVPVQSVDQVRALLKDKPKSVALLVQRDGERIFVPVKLS